MYIYTHTHVYIYTYIDIHTHVYTYRYRYRYTYTYIYAYMAPRRVSLEVVRVLFSGAEMVSRLIISHIYIYIDIHIALDLHNTYTYRYAYTYIYAYMVPQRVSLEVVRVLFSGAEMVSRLIISHIYIYRYTHCSRYT